MVTIQTKQTQLAFEGPREVTVDNVQYWSRHYKMLEKSQQSKALKFLDHNCIQYIGSDAEFDSKYTFICLPLNTQEEWTVDGRVFKKKAYTKDYNNSEYKIYKNTHGMFECNCQAWQSKKARNELYEDGCNCSHVLALFLAFKCKLFNRSHGADPHHLEADREETSGDLNTSPEARKHT